MHNAFITQVVHGADDLECKIHFVLVSDGLKMRKRKRKGEREVTTTYTYNKNSQPLHTITLLN